MELDRIQNRQWNADRVIIFQTVFLQHFFGVSRSINIRDRIDSRLDLWKKGSYDDLVQDSHRAAEKALGNICGNQTQDQYQFTF